MKIASQNRVGALMGALALLLCAAQAEAATKVNAKPTWYNSIAFQVSKPASSLPTGNPPDQAPADDEAFTDFREEREVRPPVTNTAFKGDGAINGGKFLGPLAAKSLAPIGSPLFTFEGLGSIDTFNIFGGRANPPDTVGDVGPTQYVEMTNLTMAVFDKATGNKLMGPVNIGDLWDGFPIADCSDASGDPVVLYDQTTDRWVLSQFTTRGLNHVSPEYNCFAVSVSGDATGAYYLYAFPTQTDDVAGGSFFPDYPKVSVWADSYIMTTRDFGNGSRYGISVYAIDKNKMIAGIPTARAVRFFLEYGVNANLEWIGDGLLPPDMDGSRRPQAQIAAPIIGTQDDGGGYGASFDAINIFDLKVIWNSKPVASLTGPTQLPVAAFDSIFPCTNTARRCLAQPGATTSQKLDILSYRQRPTYRLAYRNFGTYESLVTNQSVEAAPGVAGVRWYEVRRTSGVYSVYQQGTLSPGDGVNRWMGSAAMDASGNMAIGYSVVDGTSVFPGIRYTGRMKSDPLGTLGLSEGTIVDGTGFQRSVNNRWGDYSSMNIDPVDDCTFWFANEYYTALGQSQSTAGWSTKISSFKLPNCVKK